MNRHHEAPDLRRALSNYYVGDSTMAEALTTLCAAVLEAIPEGVLIGISMIVDDRPRTPIFSHPDVALSAGPHPESGAGAAGRGLLSVLSLPLIAGSHLVGSMNVYARGEHAFDQSAEEVGEGFATQAANLLLNQQAYWDGRSLDENLGQAMVGRTQIEQAKGIIMATTGASADEAFDQLRQRSVHENVRLRVIARETVEQSQQHNHPQT